MIEIQSETPGFLALFFLELRMRPLSTSISIFRVGTFRRNHLEQKENYPWNLINRYFDYLKCSSGMHINAQNVLILQWNFFVDVHSTHRVSDFETLVEITSQSSNVRVLCSSNDQSRLNMLYAFLLRNGTLTRISHTKDECQWEYARSHLNVCDTL